MQWGIRKRDPLAIDICKDLVKKMEEIQNIAEKGEN